MLFNHGLFPFLRFQFTLEYFLKLVKATWRKYWCMSQQSLSCLLYQHNLLHALLSQLFIIKYILCYSDTKIYDLTIHNFDTKLSNAKVEQQCSFPLISNSNTFLTIENRNCSCFGASFKFVQNSCCWVRAKNKLQLINFASFVSSVDEKM